MPDIVAEYQQKFTGAPVPHRNTIRRLHEKQNKQRKISLELILVLRVLWACPTIMNVSDFSRVLFS